MIAMLWNSPQARWFRYILVTWMIPMFFVLLMAADFLANRTAEETERIFTRLEARLSDLSMECEPGNYFQGRLGHWFHTELEGKNLRPDEALRKIRQFSSRFPPKAMKVFLFDGGGKVMTGQGSNGHTTVSSQKIAGNAEGAKRPAAGDEKYHITRFFEIVRAPWNRSFLITREEAKAFSEEFPFPNMIVRFMKQRPGQLHDLGGDEEFSWGFYDWQDGYDTSRIGGIMVFLHRRAFSDDYFLRRACEKFNDGDFSFGFQLEGGQPAAPPGIPRQTVDGCEAGTRLSANPRFLSPNHLGLHLKPDRKSSLFGFGPSPRSPPGSIVTGLILYFLLSFIYLRSTFRKIVLGGRGNVSVRWKLLMFFTLAFGLPMGLSLYSGGLFVRNDYQRCLDEHQYEVLTKLQGTDNRFRGFLQRRVLKFQKVHDFYTRNSDRPREILKAMSDLKFRGLIDNIWFVSSDSRFLLSPYRTMGAELRFLSWKSFRERMEFLSRIVYRGGIPIWFDLPFFIRRDFPPFPREHFPFPPQFTLLPETMNNPTFHFILFLQQTAFDEYHRIQGLEIDRKQEVQRMVVGSMIGDAADQLQMRTRATMGQWMEIEGLGHYGMNFYNIIPAKNRYARFLYTYENSLLTFEHAFLNSYFQLDPAREAGNEIAALSLYSGANCYPDFGYFRRYEGILGRLEKTQNSLVIKTVINDEIWAVVALKCRFMKSYRLLSATPLRLVLARYRRTRMEFLKIAGLVLLLGITFFYWLHAHFWKPIGGFSEGAKALREKRFSHRLKWDSRDEFGHFAESFNQTMLMLKDMEIGSAMQRQILPPGSLAAGKFEIFAHNEMAKAIGGDFFDYFSIGEEKYVVVFGDVSGHGMSAALVTAVMKAAFFHFCRRFPMEPDRVLDGINRYMLAQLKQTKMMTCFLGFLDSTSGTLICSNAGQTYPLLLGKGKSSELKDVKPKAPLGLLRKMRYSSFRFVFENQDLLFFSDGLIELHNADGFQLGFSGFRKIAERIFSRNLEFPLPALFKEIRDFSGPDAWPDDATALVIRPRKGTGGQSS